jgi:serine/threonine protein kinase/tetratricopeptide (TPR) repeat protein
MVYTVGDRLGRFEIRGPVGAGGMGEVYRAWDDVLEREVAVKVLPRELDGDADRRRRFEREARAIARLSHPNILAIHDFGRDGNASYAVTELLEGETMRERLGRGAIDWREAVRVSARVASGLAAAHREGVIHRDITPANIFVTTDGHIKILDFGLSRVAAAPSADGDKREAEATLTQHGEVTGTLGYMSPEQLTGRRTDARSDIFALGCVLHEMLCGRRVFKRDSAAETMAATLHEQPPPLEKSHRGLPPDLAAVVARCLDKQPERRFQSAEDLRFALEGLLSGAAPSPPKGARRPRRGRIRWIGAAALVAVVALVVTLWIQNSAGPKPSSPPAEGPSNRVLVSVFENRSRDASLDPLGLQISDAIGDLLGSLDGVTVAIPNAASDDTSEADLVVSGTFYQRGDLVEIRPRVVDPRTGEIVQAFAEEAAPARDPTAAIDTVSQRVAGSLAAHVDGEVPLGLAHPIRLDAYRQYVTARSSWGVDPRATARHFERALELDPQFALADTMFAWFLTNRGDLAGADARIEALEDRLPALTPLERSGVRATRARLAGRPLEALEATREAVELAPTIAWLQFNLGAILIRCNRPREAVEVLSRFSPDWISGSHALAAQPFIELNISLHLIGEYAEELRIARESLAQFPDSVVFVGQQGDALAALGRFDEIARLAEDCFTIPARHGTAGLTLRIVAEELRAHGHPEPSAALAERVLEWYRTQPPSDNPRHRMELARVLQLTGRWDDSRAILDQLAAQRPDDLRVLGMLGVVSAHLGDRARARRCADSIDIPDDDASHGYASLLQARIAAKLGDHENAIRLIRQALSEGRPYSIGFHRDIALEPLWNEPEFLEILAPKG